MQQMRLMKGLMTRFDGYSLSPDQREIGMMNL